MNQLKLIFHIWILSERKQVALSKTSFQEQRGTTALQLSLGYDTDSITKEVCFVHVVRGEENGAT